tara:strand:+ start:12997 stop:13245 length:249 start_codon:yes stop_codon:yes gene_type:complete
MKTNNNCYAFVDRVFTEPKENHKELPWVNYKDIPLESTKYTWEYFGKEKYGRYAVCTVNKGHVTLWGQEGAKPHLQVCEEII